MTSPYPLRAGGFARAWRRFRSPTAFLVIIILITKNSSSLSCVAERSRDRLESQLLASRRVSFVSTTEKQTNAHRQRLLCAEAQPGRTFVLRSYPGTASRFRRVRSFISYYRSDSDRASGPQSRDLLIRLNTERAE